MSQAILGGLPHTIQLDQDLRLILFVPTGLATVWRDADPTTVVTQSAGELSPSTVVTNSAIGDATRAPARVALQISGTIVASVPLAAGLRRTLPDSGNADIGSRVELAILSWDIRAGSLRGSGDFGSRLTLAWRRADKAVERFLTPTVSSQLVARLEPQFRMASELGRTNAARLARFQNKKEFSR